MTPHPLLLDDWFVSSDCARFLERMDRLESHNTLNKRGAAVKLHVTM